MNVVFINHSDTQGGAAIVTVRLMHALKREGIDARMLVTDKHDIDVYTRVVGNPLLNRYRWAAERIGVLMRNGFNRDTLFKIDTLSHGVNVARHPWVRQADVVVLAWVNQGTLSFRSIRQLHRAGKPIVWTMHDMWNCTGVCHHAFECQHYRQVCQQCPLLSSKGHDLSTTTQRHKARLYAEMPIHFVAVSHWLAECCRNSSLMSDADLRVIYNAFPIEQFNHQRIHGDGFNSIPDDRQVVIVGARRLDETIKGFDQLIAVTRHIAHERPALAQRLHLLLYGDIANPSLLQQLALPYTYVGAVTGSETINNLYRHADVVLSTSLYENLPGTLIEGQASGCVPVTFGKGGQADIVDHLQSGYIADYLSPASVADGLQWAIDAGIDRQWLHSEVDRKFNAQAIAQQYIDLFHALT